MGKRRSVALLGRVVFVLSFFLFAQTAIPDTVLSVGNPDLNFSSGLWVSASEALSVSWIVSRSYENVSVYAPLVQGGANDSNPVYAYLTTRLGSGATAANEIAASNSHFTPSTDSSVRLFSGIALTPGTYYLTVWSPSAAGGGWLFSEDPTTSVDAGVSIGASQYIGISPLALQQITEGLYVPSFPFVNTYPNEHLVFSVETEAGPAQSPEPCSIFLLGFGCVGLQAYPFIRSVQRSKD